MEINERGNEEVSKAKGVRWKIGKLGKLRSRQ